MYKTDEFFDILQEFAPMSIEEILLANGEYDNSGIIVRSHDDINCVLFSLDLSKEAVRQAKKVKADTIVTHHPAIYKPIKNIDFSDTATSALLEAIKSGFNVISMHLNLDYAEDGIDANLCKALGGTKYRLIDMIDEKHGYGRLFPAPDKTLGEFAKRVRASFGKKVLVYGNPKSEITEVASFCGGGSGYAIEGVKDGRVSADVIVTSDAPHHVIKELVEYGKKLIFIPHYAGEEVGFKAFYEKVKEKCKRVNAYYFKDKRFI